MTAKRYMSARQAAAVLGISPATLYAYVSRGLIRSEAGPDKRARRYHVQDIERLKQRREQRRNPDKAARATLRAGMPVLDSAIALITDTCLYYRGHSALELARQHSFEEVAALLWSGDLGAALPVDEGPALSEACQAVLEQADELTPCERMQIVLPVAGAQDWRAYDLTADGVVATGVRILRLLAAASSGQQNGGGLAAALQQAWAPKQPQARRLFEAALILCADHELNASSFTARCVASTGATPYAAVTAGLAALSGPKHGGHVSLVEDFLDQCRGQGGPRSVIAARLQQAGIIPGFGHIVYQGADPRASLLLELLEESFPGDRFLALVRQTVALVEEATGHHCNIDLGLGALVQQLGLPPGSAQALFALGRTAGWIAQVGEEYKRDQLIRPRARYTGPQPTSR
ncbi:MAG: helix-turn-helix domain-containing protein [Candidatus Latescibacteria bacterium]|nr:helix-turn-helix domain-containing protein [Candidatus Latescibacterota bacterium]